MTRFDLVRRADGKLVVALQEHWRGEGCEYRKHIASGTWEAMQAARRLLSS